MPVQDGRGDGGFQPGVLKLKRGKFYVVPQKKVS